MRDWLVTRTARCPTPTPATDHRLIASSRRLFFSPGSRRPNCGNSPTPDQETFRAIEFKTSGAVSDDGPPDQAREPVPQPLTLPKTNRVVARVEHAHRQSVLILALRPCSFKRARVEFSQRFFRSVRRREIARARELESLVEALPNGMEIERKRGRSRPLSATLPDRARAGTPTSSRSRCPADAWPARRSLRPHQAAGNRRSSGRS
jgi:hypothetical protein